MQDGHAGRVINYMGLEVRYCRPVENHCMEEVEWIEWIIRRPFHILHD